MCKKKISNLLDYLYKYRFIVCFIIFLFSIIFEVSGSSIGAWNNVINVGTKSSDVGISRNVRSDEWATFTPMMFSQKYNNYKTVSSILRGGNTNVFLIYGLPTTSIFQIYRPFQLGFLFLDNAKGLSFFWIGRILALFLVSLEFFMILSNRNKKLSYIGSILITLSPIINWWFAVNGIAEMFIFGEGIIILLYYYLKNSSFYKRLLYLILMIICAGGYIMTFYPAWQIPLAYVFFVIALWIILDNYKGVKICKRDILAILISFVIFVLSIIYILVDSKDVINIIMHTDYPGSRFEIGGGQISKYILYIISPLLPYIQAPNGLNQSEAALMFGLFPIGLIMTIRTLIKSKKKDLLLILLMIIYVLFSIWCIFGFPKILAKISLLYTSPSHRSFIAIGFLDIIILIRALSVIEIKDITHLIGIIIAIILPIVMIYMLNSIYSNYLSVKMIVFILILLISLFYLVLNYNKKICKVLFIIEITFTMIITSCTINPIRTGTDIIYKSPILKKVKQIDNKDSGIWITEGVNYPLTNYIINVGVKNINGTNTYPNLKLWKKLDPKGKYKFIYNRYAHITVILCDEKKVYSDKFQLISQDVFKVYVTVDDLKKMNVKYLFTINNLDNSANNIKKLYTYGKYSIYKISEE